MSAQRSHLTRILHVAVLLAVIHQLASSLIMERPLAGDDPEAPFLSHVWVGTAALQILFAFWLWTLVRDRRETAFGQLFPWFSASRLRGLFADVGHVLGEFAALRLPLQEPTALKAAIHGLGLTTATFLGATGALWWFVFQGSFVGKLLLLSHMLAGNLMWAYLIGHATMAVLHHLFGKDTLLQMFWPRPAARG